MEDIDLPPGMEMALFWCSKLRAEGWARNVTEGSSVFLVEPSRHTTKLTTCYSLLAPDWIRKCIWLAKCRVGRKGRKGMELELSRRTRIKGTKWWRRRRKRRRRWTNGSLRMKVGEWYTIRTNFGPILENVAPTERKIGPCGSRNVCDGFVYFIYSFW